MQQNNKPEFQRNIKLEFSQTYHNFNQSLRNTRKASFLFPQKFLRRSDKAFVDLSCIFHDVVTGICCSFVVEPMFLYMNHCCDIELQRLYIYDTNIDVFCISMSSPICVLHYEWPFCISMYSKQYKCFVP